MGPAGRRALTLLPLIVASALLLHGLQPIAARAQGLPQIAVLLRPIAGSGAAGIARFTEKGGVVSVGVTLAEVRPGENYVSAIYRGSCPATGVGPIGTLVPFDPTFTGTHPHADADGLGIVVSSGDLFGKLASLRDGRHVIATRRSADPSRGPVVACGLIPPLATGTPWPPVGVDDAWAIVRAALPAERPIYRPTWLPSRFHSEPLPPVPGPYFGVTYQSDQGDLIVFAFGPTNSAPFTQTEPISVHGFAGNLSATDGSPPIQVTWVENGELYSVRAERGSGVATISRDELRKIVANLAPFGPNATEPSRLPRTGQESKPFGLVLGAIALLAGMTLRRLTGLEEVSGDH